MKCITLFSLCACLRSTYAILILLLASTTAVSAADTPDNSVLKHNAVILLYHHVSEETPASTSISPDTFESHMAYLSKHHTVIALTQAVDAITGGASLPENSVVITFDDGYANILHNAHPILAKYGFPYTVFINPNEIGAHRQQLTWQQVDAMHNEGVTFANHTLDHIHMLDNSQTNTHWLADVWQNVEQAEATLKDKVGVSLQYLAYPFGEFNEPLAAQVKRANYIGFGQHSGAVGPLSDTSALPRFPAAGPYSNLATLKTKLKSIAMPVVNSTVVNPALTSHTPPASVTLTIGNADTGLDIASDVSIIQTQCFFGGEKISTKTSPNKITFYLETQLPTGRSRVNCTAPSKAHRGRYYWYSQPFFVANEQGRYPD